MDLEPFVGCQPVPSLPSSPISSTTPNSEKSSAAQKPESWPFTTITASKKLFTSRSNAPEKPKKPADTAPPPPTPQSLDYNVFRVEEGIKECLRWRRENEYNNHSIIERPQEEKIAKWVKIYSDAMTCSPQEARKSLASSLAKDRRLLGCGSEEVGKEDHEYAAKWMWYYGWDRSVMDLTETAFTPMDIEHKLPRSNLSTRSKESTVSQSSTATSKSSLFSFPSVKSQGSMNSQSSVESQASDKTQVSTGPLFSSRSRRKHEGKIATNALET
ncbi:hypothetical protein P280DRAFT_207840 [Massarina eburnea CBS 473.64]|uniref:Uncharacterized protein n=1 Tax=Massarina eburnea CBS 473.64 TaxID=1395130 RepID=A0A6A6RIC6_9PLEO|nr:hypothetical protein P280DRAFT_207840 [Massarina eburnea CBS 473.64]